MLPSVIDRVVKASPSGTLRSALTTLARTAERSLRPGATQRALDGPKTTDTQGSHLVRWAAVEAAQRHHGFQSERFEAITARRDSKKIARVALARHIITLVYFGLRDGEIRCLAEKAG